MVMVAPANGPPSPCRSTVDGGAGSWTAEQESWTAEQESWTAEQGLDGGAVGRRSRGRGRRSRVGRRAGV
jgi:hypothetical protein